MWRRRRGFPLTELGLPKKCFISHAYKDAEARQQLLARLPNDVQPFIFPPITVAPDQFVSNELVAAILESDGLIYLRGGASAQSFWVAFERDYALRAHKPVYCYDPRRGTLSRDTLSPLDLHMYALYVQESEATRLHVEEILEFMHQQRFFFLHDLSSVRARPGGILDPTDGMVDGIRQGGYVICFWSKHEGLSFAFEIMFARNIYPGQRKPSSRVIVALLDDSPPPLSPGVPDPRGQLMSVQLYADGDRSWNQRIDDLIVRLYWLIYRNTRQNQHN